MSKVRLIGSTSGYTEITSQNVAGENTITLPSSNGSANQLLKNGATAGSLEFASNVVIDSSGSLLVGTSTARANLVASTPRAQLEGTDFDTSIYSSVRNSNDNGGANLILAKSRGTAIGSNTVVQANDQFGVVRFVGSDGTNFIAGASINGLVDGAPGANDMPGRLVFSTTADGASIPTERMRINNTGTLFAGTTSLVDVATNAFGFNYVPGNFLCVATTVGGNACAIFNKTNSQAGLVVAIRYNGTDVGSITNTSTTTAYNTSSDYRLKENVVFLTGAIDRLQQIPVHRFNFIADPDTVVDGFIAHEAQAVVPECVTGTKDEVDDDGNPVYQGIDQSKLVPLLTAALQEALQQIEALTARVTALEAQS